MPRIERGGTFRVLARTVVAGGKGANAAHAAALLGADVTLVGFAGGSRGAEFARLLRDRGVRGALVRCRGETRRTFCFLDPRGRDPTLVIEEGSRVSRAEVRRFERAALAAIRSFAPQRTGRALVLAGSVPPGLDASIYGRLARAARRRAVPVVVDAHGPPLVAAVRAGVDAISANEEELAGLAAERGSLRARSVAAVCLKRGERGLVLIDRDGAFVARAAIVRGNPTGSGDVITAHLAYALARGVPLASVLAHAVAAAAANVLHDEPATFRAAEVASRMKRVTVRRVSPRNSRSP